MDVTVFDRATRAFGAASRRTMLRTLAGLALSSAAGVFTGIRSQAAEADPTLLGNYGDDVSIEKNKKKKRKQKRCKKEARNCNVDVAGWCGTFWLDYDSCRASLGSCCAQIKNCKYGAGNACIDNNPYYFLA